MMASELNTQRRRFMADPQPLIHWFRQDLRLGDHPALSAAVASGSPVIPLYILDDETPGRWAPGGASRWWLYHSLEVLQESLAKLGAPLVLRRGRALDVLLELVRETDAKSVCWTRCYEPHAAALEAKLAFELEAEGVEWRRFGGSLLYEPEAVSTTDDRPYRVFTPFWRACRGLSQPKVPVSAPKRIEAVSNPPRSERLADWGLLPTPDWAGGLRSCWTPGERGAQSALERFLEDALGDYAGSRDRPDRRGTSRLSPHLHHGEISPRQCWHAVQSWIGAGGSAKDGEAFMRELFWREFSYHLLHHFPSLPDSPFRDEFEEFAWHSDRWALEPWQGGRTGFPIVDAAMRELWHTGWMHNRARMVVASFLVKDLLIPWQEGEAWFWDTLVDADLANNAASWQWVAGCGADAAPYFRVFNPVLQGRKFDPEGHYVRQWLPALAALPAEHIHAPWEAPASVLDDADVRLGDTYPQPIVDHREARKRALAAYERIKGF